MVYTRVLVLRNVDFIFFLSNRDRGRRSRSRLRRRSRSRGGRRRRSRSKIKEDKFKGSLSEGMKVEQESSSDDK